MSNISRFIGNERGDKICHEDDGCPTELAVLKRFWREQQASTLPEEVANLVELLDEEEVPYEDSLGVALSLTGRTKQYANGKTATLSEQVEKLTKERDDLTACVCAMQDYQAGIGITAMFDQRELLGRTVLIATEQGDITSPVLNRIKGNK